jgi:hypothetical protein
MRTIHREIEAIQSARRIYELCKNQYFCDTPKAYEIWETLPDGREIRIHRIPRKRIFWVHEYAPKQ